MWNDFCLIAIDLNIKHRNRVLTIGIGSCSRRCLFVLYIYIYAFCVCRIGKRLKGLKPTRIPILFDSIRYVCVCICVPFDLFKPMERHSDWSTLITGHCRMYMYNIYKCVCVCLSLLADVCSLCSYIFCGYKILHDCNITAINKMDIWFEVGKL